MGRETASEKRKECPLIKIWLSGQPKNLEREERDEDEDWKGSYENEKKKKEQREGQQKEEKEQKQHEAQIIDRTLLSSSLLRHSPSLYTLHRL